MVSGDAKSAYVHRVFSRIAKRYDVMNSVLSFQQHKLWRRFTMKKMQIQKGASILDVAAGTGDWTFASAEAVGKDGQVYGLDFCQEMLDVAIERQKHREAAHQARFLLGDAMDLPFENNAFDFTTIGFALRNVPDIRTVLKEMTRVTKPGGLVVSLELSKPEFPPFRALYYFYFQKILPRIGGIISGEREAYAWLPESLRTFPNREELETMFHEAGLQDVRSYPLTGGIAALHIGKKGE